MVCPCIIWRYVLYQQSALFSRLRRTFCSRRPRNHNPACVILRGSARVVSRMQKYLWLLSLPSLKLYIRDRWRDVFCHLSRAHELANRITLIARSSCIEFNLICDDENKDVTRLFCKFVCYRAAANAIPCESSHRRRRAYVGRERSRTYSRIHARNYQMRINPGVPTVLIIFPSFPSGLASPSRRVAPVRGSRRVSRKLQTASININSVAWKGRGTYPGIRCPRPSRFALLSFRLFPPVTLPAAT